MRKLVLGTLIAFVAVLLTAPAFAATVLKFSSIHEPNHPSAYTAEFFASRVKQLTKGEVEVQVYHSRQLGDARDNVENVRNGSIAFTSVSVSNLSQVVPAMDAFSLPFIFKTGDHFWYCLNDPKAMEFMKQLEPKGIKTLTWIDSGARNFFTQKPVRSVADMKGMKIRVQPSDIQIQAINEMGGIGTPLAFGEVYLALQQKVLDGAENSPALYWTSKHWEVSKVYSLTEQFWSVSTFIANKKWWDGLPKDIQADITAAGQDAEKFFLEAYVSLESKAIGLLKDKGVTVVTDVDKATFEKRIQPVYDNFVKKYPFGKDLLEQARAAKKK